MPAPALLVRPTYASIVRNMPGLIGYWRMGEKFGTVARDELNVSNGTYIGSPGLGKPGLLVGDGDTAATFVLGNGVTLPALALSASQARTIAMWVTDTTGANTDFRTLFVYGTNGTTGIFYVVKVPTATLRVFDGGVDMNANPVTGWTQNVIHFCVAVYNGTGWVFSLDGSLLGTPVTGAAGASVSPRIGHWASVTTDDWIGTFDDTAVWNRALNDNEIRTLYNAGRGL